MEKTAVQWIEETIGRKHMNEFLKSVIDQAKAMEKQQIMMAVKDSWYMAKGSNFQEPQEEQYYNETFK